MSVACQTTTPLPAQDQPRTNLKKNLLLHREEPLQPPLSNSKLNFQDYIMEVSKHLNYIASHPLLLQAQIQRHRSTTPSCDPLPSRFPSPATFRKATTSLQSTAQKDESDADLARSLLRDIFYDVAFSSKLYCEIYTSANLLISILTASPTV